MRPSFPDLTPVLRAKLPNLRGRLSANAMMSDLTWFRVGGPAQVFFSPADEADLAYFLKSAPRDLPTVVVGLGSNLLVRDGGFAGIVIRLGRGFADISPDLTRHRITAGTAVPDAKLAQAAAVAGISGLAFYRGIPGSIGGALRMNAGAHGSETTNVLVSARAVDRDGNIHLLSHADMGFTYRHCAILPDWIFTQATFHGTPGATADILKHMDEVAAYREANQPVRERTGGSTFKNPPGLSAWKLIDEAGCRGLRVGGAMVSNMHCNFLINADNASAEDIERLGETVRARVREKSGTDLSWEIIRLGDPLPGRTTGAALAG